MEHGTGFVAQLDGMWFHGRRFDYQPGAYVTRVEGLGSGAEVAFDNLRTGRTPGVLDIDGTRERERSIVISGFAYAESLRAVGSLVDQLAHILVDESRHAVLTWTDLAQSRHAFVRRSSIVATRRGATRFVDFTLKLRAPDQRIYGPTVGWSSWGASVTVDHRGYYPAPTTIQVAGSSTSGYTVSGPQGRSLVVARALTSANAHEYDSDTGVVIVAGSALETGIARADSIEIPRGRHTLTVNNGAQLRVRFPTTYAP